MRNRLTFTLALLVMGMVCAPIVAQQRDRPNVVLMMADDLGYGDLSCYGSQRIRTPKLDNLAGEGIRLTSFYSGCTICTPSRMALLTGAYPRRLGWRGGVVGYRIKPNNGLSPKAVTMAEVFQDAGYRTALIGKWHLGDSPELSPMKQGFDTAYYIDKSNNQTKKLWRNGELVANPFENRRLTEQFATEAVRFIENHRDQPFFLYVPFSAPHFPAEAHPDWQDKSQNHAYGDVVEELDHRVGEIVAALAKQKIEDKTIVVFLSDNGVEPGQRKWASASPYRGLKWSALEGGNRVPCIVRWPEAIPAGRESDALIATIDLYPTLAAACGIELPNTGDASPKIDGVNVLRALTGKTESHPRESLLYFHGWGTLQAIRIGSWKLYVDEVKEISETKNGPVLIDLANDPAEENNLHDQHPQRVASMMKEAARQLTEIKEKTIALGGPEDSTKLPAPAKWLK